MLLTTENVTYVLSAISTLNLFGNVLNEIFCPRNLTGIPVFSGNSYFTSIDDIFFRLKPEFQISVYILKFSLEFSLAD